MPAQVRRLVQRLGRRAGADFALALANLAVRPLGADTHNIGRARIGLSSAARIPAPSSLRRGDRFQVRERQALILLLGGGEGGIRTLDTA